jgi:carbon starvation protein CstA
MRITFPAIMRDVQGAPPEMIAKVLPLTIVIIIVPVLALVAIFLFKNRILQLRVVTILILMTVVLILLLAYYSYVVISNYDGSITLNVKMLIPVVLLILSFLAFRGIKKDELLVKSYDRLR